MFAPVYLDLATEDPMKYAALVNENVPQSEPFDDRQVKNNAGGYVFQFDDWK